MNGLAKAVRTHKQRRALTKLSLSPDLVNYIKTGTLQQRIEELEKEYDGMVAAYEAWEAANPHALTPWKEAREEWKRAGRPRPPWYELLWLFDSPEIPIRKKDIEQHLIISDKRRVNKKKAVAKKRAAEAALKK